MSEGRTLVGTAVDGSGAAGFRHTLCPYDGPDGFLDGATSFIDDAAAHDETVVVALEPPREQSLRDRLSESGSGANVSFMDLAALGRNPSRLIPAWQSWIAELAADGRPVRGIGESAWDSPDAALASELRYHEYLLNLAFAKSPAWWLLCPYDTSRLQAPVLEAARRTHPQLWIQGIGQANAEYDPGPYVFEDLPLPVGVPRVMAYTGSDLSVVRDKVTACANAHNVVQETVEGLRIAATEIATNSIRHAGGWGTLRTWTQDDWLICEFHDTGHITDPLAGRLPPTPGQLGGHGLWLANQLCDLVQIRTSPHAGTTIRLHTAIGNRAG